MPRGLLGLSVVTGGRSLQPLDQFFSGLHGRAVVLGQFMIS